MAVRGARCPWRAGWPLAGAALLGLALEHAARLAVAAPCSACWPGGGWGAASNARSWMRSGADDACGDIDGGAARCGSSRPMAVRGARCPWRAGWRWPARRCWAWRWNMPRRSGCSAPRCSACWPGGGWGAAVQCAQLDARSGADDVRRHRRRPGHAARRARFRLAHAQRHDVRWRTETYDLSRLESVDVALSYWGAPRSPMRWCPLASATAGTWCSRSRYAASWAMRSPRSGLLPPVRAVGAGVHRRGQPAGTHQCARRGRLPVSRAHARGRGARVVLAYVETANGWRVNRVETANGLARQPRFYNTLTANCITIVPAGPAHRARAADGLPAAAVRLSARIPVAASALRGADSARPIATPAAIPTARAPRPTRRSSRAISARACPANEEGFLVPSPDGAVFILGRPGYENLWSARFLQARRCRRNWACSNLFESLARPRSMMRVAPGKPKPLSIAVLDFMSGFLPGR